MVEQHAYPRLPTMPHSVSSNDSAPHNNNDDEIMPDAPSAPDNEAVTEEQKGQTNQNAEGNVKLEDLFADDDDDDDEFPASSAPDVKMESSPPPIPAAYDFPYEVQQEYSVIDLFSNFSKCAERTLRDRGRSYACLLSATISVPTHVSMAESWDRAFSRYGQSRICRLPTK